MLIAACVCSHSHAQSEAAAKPRQPVLVELFTSEGCSDCPPADALLMQLDRKQPVAGAQVIALSEHVTYWNHLGWRDPFSFAVADQRQRNYARLFGLPSVYTPQAIVDGKAEMVGSNAGMVQHAILLAAQKPKLALTISGARLTPAGAVAFSVTVSGATQASLIAAIAEDATRSEVARGENAGRTLHHVAVARALQDFGVGAADGRPLTLALPRDLANKKDSQPLRLVVFLANRADGQVVAVEQQTLTR